MKNRAIPLLFALFLGAGLHAAENGAGTTALPFLKTPFGSRGVAMGDAYSAVAEGAEALYWNPAGLALKRGLDASFSYAPLMESMNYESLGIGYSLTEKSSVGLAFSTLAQAPLETTDASGRPSGSVSPSDSMLQASYSRLEGRSSWGVSFKQVRSRLGDASASALAWDGGVRTQWGGRFSASAGFRNMGQKIRYDQEAAPLPRSYYVGSSWGPSKTLLFSSQVDVASVGGERLGVGAEWTRPAGPLSTAFRAGYSFSKNSTAFNLGLGLGKGPLSFDYAFAPLGELGPTHRMTLGYHFAAAPALSPSSRPSD